MFLASDDPADIARLTEAYPKFRKLYAEIAAELSALKEELKKLNQTTR